MPTILRVGAARFFFYSNEGQEPPHVHVEQGDGVAKFWLDPVALTYSSRFSGHELRRLESVVSEHRTEFLKAWREFFRT